MPARSKAVFLDRDGTIIKNAHYLSDLSQIEILPGVPQALTRLKSSGFLLVLITNQSGVARGFITEDFVVESNQKMNQMLIQAGAPSLDAFYYCPHHPDHGSEKYKKDCDCRKPKSGMLTQAAEDLNIDLANSFMVGDSPGDTLSGKNVGSFSILLSDTENADADAIASDLAEAVEIILKKI